MRPARSPSGEFCPGRSGAGGEQGRPGDLGTLQRVAEGGLAGPPVPLTSGLVCGTVHMSPRWQLVFIRSTASCKRLSRPAGWGAGTRQLPRLAHVLLCARLEPGLRGGPRTGEARAHRAAPRPPPAQSPHRSTSPCVARLETRPRPGQPGSVPCRAVEGDLPQTSPRTPPWR